MTTHDYTIKVPFAMGKQRPRVTMHDETTIRVIWSTTDD